MSFRLGIAGSRNLILVPFLFKQNKENGTNPEREGERSTTPFDKKFIKLSNIHKGPFNIPITT